MNSFTTSINKANQAAKTIENKYLLFKRMYENTTPWWGRSPLGSNLDSINSVRIFGLPTAKSLVGKVRWVMAMILSSRCGTDRVSLERTISDILGSTSKASSYRLIMNIDMLPDKDSVDKSIKDKRSAINFFSNRGKDRYLPIRPGAIKVTLQIYRNYRKNPINLTRNYEEFLKGAIKLTLYVYGFGYRANRGFGRFMPTENNERIDAWSIIENLERMNILVPSNCANASGEWILSPNKTLELMQNKLKGRNAPSKHELAVRLRRQCKYDDVLKSILDSTVWNHLKWNLPRKYWNYKYKKYKLVLGAPRRGIDKNRRQSEIIIAPVCYHTWGQFYCKDIYVLPHYGKDLTNKLFGGNITKHLEVLADYSLGVVNSIRHQLSRRGCR